MARLVWMDTKMDIKPRAHQRDKYIFCGLEL